MVLRVSSIFKRRSPNVYAQCTKLKCTNDAEPVEILWSVPARGAEDSGDPRPQAGRSAKAPTGAFVWNRCFCLYICHLVRHNLRLRNTDAVSGADRCSNHPDLTHKGLCVILYRAFDIKSKWCAMPKIVDHNAYREELLQAAFALFARQGYGEVSMRQLADALGVSTGTLYHYFPSKESLFQQAVIRVVSRDLDAWQEAVAHLDSLDDKLRALFDLILAQREDLTSALLLTIDFYRRRQPVGGETAIMAALEDYMNAVAGLLALPREVCSLLLAALDGLLLHHYPLKDHNTLASGLDRLRAMVVAYTQAAVPATNPQKGSPL